MTNPEEERSKNSKGGVPKKPALPAVKLPIPVVKKPGMVVKPQTGKPQVAKPVQGQPKPTLSSLNPEGNLGKPAGPVVAKPMMNIPVPQPKFIAEHTVKDEDTLGGIALKYYGSAKKEYWMFIYDANKTVIGDRPNVLRPGIVLKIPEKPTL